MGDPFTANAAYDVLAARRQLMEHHVRHAHTEEQRAAAAALLKEMDDG